jgi:hypothetical protein
MSVGIDRGRRRGGRQQGRRAIRRPVAIGYAQVRRRQCLLGGGEGGLSGRSPGSRTGAVWIQVGITDSTRFDWAGTTFWPHSATGAPKASMLSASALRKLGLALLIFSLHQLSLPR